MSNLWKQIIRAIIAVLLQFLDLMDGPSDQKIAAAVAKHKRQLPGVDDKTV